MQVLLMQITSMTMSPKIKTITPALYCHISQRGITRAQTDLQGHWPWTHGRQTGSLPGGLNLPDERRQARRSKWEKSSWCRDWRDTLPCPRQPPYWLQRVRKYQKSIFLMNYENYIELLLNKEINRTFTRVWGRLVTELIETHCYIVFIDKEK